MRYYGICYFYKFFSNKYHLGNFSLDFISKQKDNWLTISYFSYPAHVHAKINDEASLNSSGGGSIDHIAFLFSARDFQPIKESIERDGVDHLHTIVPGLELRQIFLKDPDGIRIELNFPPE